MGCLTMIEVKGGLSLLDRVEAYLLSNKLAPTKFGKLVVKSPSLVARMREGKTLRRCTIERIEVFLTTPRRIIVPQPLTAGQWKSRRYRAAIAEQIRNDLAERNRRMSDPCELAAIFLRSRRFIVTKAWVVHGAEAEGWCVGNTRETDDELQARARRMGWEG